jgi:hypothetical protein
MDVYSFLTTAIKWKFLGKIEDRPADGNREQGKEEPV